MGQKRMTQKIDLLKWPREWWFEEKFWRDVASRGLAGLIVLGVTALAAFGSGLLDNPIYKGALIRLFVCIVILAAWIPLSNLFISKVGARWGKLGITVTALISIAALFAALIFFAQISIP